MGATKKLKSQQGSGNTLLNNALVVMINKYQLLSSIYLVPVYNDLSVCTKECKILENPCISTIIIFHQFLKFSKNFSLMADLVKFLVLLLTLLILQTFEKKYFDGLFGKNI